MSTAKCEYQVASPITYNENTTAYQFGMKRGASNSLQLCQEKQDGSFDCAPPSTGLGGLGALHARYCYNSNIQGHMKCFTNLQQCESAVAKRNGL